MRGGAIIRELKRRGPSVHFGVCAAIVRERAPQTFTFQPLRGRLFSSSEREWPIPFSSLAGRRRRRRHCANVESMESRVYPALPADRRRSESGAGPGHPHPTVA